MCRLLLTIFLLATLSGATLAVDRGGAWSLYQARKVQEAYDAARPLLDAEPADRDLNHLVGRCLVELGRYAQAKPFLEMVINSEDRRDWQYAWSFFYLGHVHWAAEERDEARATWIEARDGKNMQHVSRDAGATLKFTGTAEAFAAWPVRESDHLRCCFSPRLADRNLDAFVLAGEKVWTDLTGFFGGAPGRRVDIVVWADAAEAQQVAGINVLPYVRPELWTVHTLLEGPLGSGLARVFCPWTAHPTAETRLLTEGVAELCDQTGKDRVAAARQALRDAQITTLDLPAWWQTPQRVPGPVFGAVAGAWVQSLLDRGGKDNLLLLLRNQSYARAREIYGAETLNGWVAEFTRSLF